MTIEVHIKEDIYALPKYSKTYRNTYVAYGSLLMKIWIFFIVEVQKLLRTSNSKVYSNDHK